MATSAQALGPDPHTGTFASGQSIKVNIQEMDIGWPFEYKALDLCVIPVYMHVGYFVQVYECHKRAIKLVQVNCEDIGKATSMWPCYKDCEDVKVRSNFEVKLGLTKSKVGTIIDQWTAYFEGDDVVTPSESWQTVTVCVEAWKANLLKATPDTEVEVGQVVITVKPNV